MAKQEKKTTEDRIKELEDELVQAQKAIEDATIVAHRLIGAITILKEIQGE